MHFIPSFAAEAGADVDSRSREGAIIAGNPKDVIGHHAFRGGQTALMFAALNGHARVDQSLVEAGADVNTGDKYGTTALSWASQGPYPSDEIVRVLTEKGVVERD